MHERDEKLFDTSLTVVVFAENEKKLDEYTESLITEYTHVLRGSDITNVMSCKTMQKAYKERIIFYPYQALSVVMLMNIFEKKIS